MLYHSSKIIQNDEKWLVPTNKTAICLDITYFSGGSISSISGGVKDPLAER